MPPEGPAALSALGVSRETEALLSAFVERLRHWQTATNLVSKASLAEVWTRHVADSAQLVALFPSGRRWLDLGSGAGFPGLVIAAMLASKPDAVVHLVESDRRKAAFLATVARELSLPAVVHVDRIESVVKRWSEPLDFVSARALAPLDRLCDFLEPLVSDATRAVLPKGANFSVELEAAAHRWDIDLIRWPSLIDSSGSIIEIRRISRATGTATRRARSDDPPGR